MFSPSSLSYRRHRAAEGLRCDQIIALASDNSARDYPDKLRRIRFYACGKWETQGSASRATLGYMIPIPSGLAAKSEKIIDQTAIKKFR